MSMSFHAVKGEEIVLPVGKEASRYLFPNREPDAEPVDNGDYNWMTDLTLSNFDAHALADELKLPGGSDVAAFNTNPHDVVRAVKGNMFERGMGREAIVPSGILADLLIVCTIAIERGADRVYMA